MKNKTSFNLIRQFGLFSFVSILLLAIVTGYTLSHFLTEKMLYREATLTQEFVNSIIQTDRIFDHFKPSDIHAMDKELVMFFHHLANMPDVVKAKVYDANMVLMWDSDRQGEGVRNPDNDELSLSLEGNLVTEFGMSRKDVKAEHRTLVNEGEDIHFIETYIPVWNGDYSQVLGSIELYKEPRVLHDAIIESRYLVWSIALLGSLLLFTTLFWIVWRANRIILDQQSKLVESESLSMIGETASAVAHAMRNALASIRASAELSLEDDLQGARESAHDIISESDRLNRWATELLKFSGDGGDSVQDVDLVELLESVIDEHRLVLHKGNVELVTDYGDGDFTVTANTAPLSQVFGNLIMNAVEAMDHGGNLLIRLRLLDTESHKVCVEVIDSGPGLSDEIVGQLFKPFATTKATGTGLGLTLTRRMLSRYNGSIALSSELGQGATARVVLPMKRNTQ